MLRRDALKGRFEKRARSRPIAYAAEIGEDGLVVGAGTILARMSSDSLGALDLEEGEDRLGALLAAAHGRPMSPDLPRHLGEAFAHWRRGQKALANIRLAFAGIPRLDDCSDAYRLFLAEELLDAGMPPADLMKGLGLGAPVRGLAKFDPNQPRVPAGSGRNSGRWGSGGGNSSTNNVHKRTIRWIYIIPMSCRVARKKFRGNFRKCAGGFRRMWICRAATLTRS